MTDGTEIKMPELAEFLAGLEPEAALDRLLPLARDLLAHLDEEQRRTWFTRLLEGGQEDKLAGLVNL